MLDAKKENHDHWLFNDIALSLHPLSFWCIIQSDSGGSDADS